MQSRVMIKSIPSKGLHLLGSLILAALPCSVLAMPEAKRASVRYHSTSGAERQVFHRQHREAQDLSHNTSDYEPPADPLQLEPGDRVATLPLGHVTVAVDGQMVHYYEGFFLRQEGSSFVIIIPPVGMVVPVLPPRCSQVIFQKQPLQYCKGAFFKDTQDGFEVITAPVGAVVSKIPSNSSRIFVNGKAHYLAGGTAFRPLFHRGSLVYQVVPAI